jgi:superfamily I DNA/RNA helicase
LRKSERNVETAENRIQNLKDILATLDGEAPAGRTAVQRLETFLDDITLDTEKEEEDEGPGNAVTLITMHSCKGLEFPHVHIVGMEQGLLPHSRSLGENTLDEERRLFYVAITRARRTLNISHCAGRKKYGQVLPAHPSQFLRDLPDHLVEHADEKGKQPVAPDAGKSRFDLMRAILE